MPRLEKPCRPNATLPRRALLAAAPVLALAACEREMRVTASRGPPMDLEGLNRSVREIAASAAPAAVGMGLMNLESGETFLFNETQRFPLQGIVALPVGAAVLAETDAGRLSLDERLTLEPEQLSPPPSPIADNWAVRRDYTVRELLGAAVGQGDNTATDVLMRRVGGPGAVTAWLTGKRLSEVRVDRYARELYPEAYGMASYRPEWRGPAFHAARVAVPPAERAAAIRAFLSDPRDTATPRGLLDLLAMLDKDELTTPASTRLLLRLMLGSPGRILPRQTLVSRAVSQTDLASSAAGMFTLPDRRAYALVVSATGLDVERRRALLADAARAAVRAVG